MFLDFKASEGTPPLRLASLMQPHQAFGTALILIPDTVSCAFVTAGKILQQMRKNLKGWRIEELQVVAERNFVDWRRPGRGGSHVIFSAPGVREIVSVPPSAQ